MKPHHILLIAAPLSRLGAAAAADDDDNAQVRVYTDDTRTYTYYGCYNETTLTPGSAGTRALADGTSLVQVNAMTVPACLKFCHDGDTKYRYAGVEWSRECWCAQNIAGIAQKLDDGECNFPCAGNKTQACGGQLKLNVYRMSAASRNWAAHGVGAALALTSMYMVVLF
ncbi:Carbohydrate-binding WSC [Beauveria brongniartii RCEF 3172]|uniref:Carbohydrate-binding WSC n=1 Tax=Beauveria brongniartii RCEF 3172 TaxID=1081107 RepID=A0A167EZ16_9HYPO|nr:Carbohydrate-binding WSC [Beauveria brongniartii RCEF 3172]